MSLRGDRLKDAVLICAQETLTAHAVSPAHMRIANPGASMHQCAKIALLHQLLPSYTYIFANKPFCRVWATSNGIRPIPLLPSSVSTSPSPPFPVKADSPTPPGKLHGGWPDSNVSRWSRIYLALLTVRGTVGMYMTAEAFSPEWVSLTACIPSQCHHAWSPGLTALRGVIFWRHQRFVKNRYYCR